MTDPDGLIDPDPPHWADIVPGRTLVNNDRRNRDQRVIITAIVDRHGHGLMVGRGAIYQAGQRPAVVAFRNISAPGNRNNGRGWMLDLDADGL